MKPPCIRGLHQFKKGCPQKPWDGSEGCTAWIEEMVIDRDNPEKKRIEKKCLDLWMFTLAWHSNGLLEGNQQAVESFRNNMCYDGGPKPDPAMIHLVKTLKRRALNGSLKNQQPELVTCNRAEDS